MGRESADTIEIGLFERRVRLSFDGSGIAALFAHCFRRFESGEPTRKADLEYSIRRDSEGFRVECPGREPLRAADDGELLFAFESDLAVALQLLRPDLFFLHAGAVGTRDGAVLLVGDSGAGKSTLTWSLVCRGFAYLSDELAPVCLDGLRVHAYPRAISFKDLPPPPFELPPGALRTSWGFRVPVGEGGSDAALRPRRIQAIFFLDPEAEPSGAPAARPTGPAEAAARLLANALNPRSHPADGLDAALAIASSVPCYRLARARLGARRELVLATLEALPHGE